jgi:hypothetical protein
MRADMLRFGARPGMKHRILVAALGLLSFLFLPLILNANQNGQQPGVDVLTNRYDNWRSGANLKESKLTVQAVNPQNFGKLFEREVDGDVYAQPLIKTAVPIQARGPRDIAFVATSTNNLYAFDADLPGEADAYWHVGPDVLGTPVPRGEVTDLKPPDEYLNFEYTGGNSSTPVIDHPTNKIYVVGK